MLQSLGRKGQQQWRSGHCSQLDDSSHRFFVNTACVSRACVSRACVSRAYIRHPYGGFQLSRPGARQFFYTYNCTQDIPQNSKPQNVHASSSEKKRRVGCSTSATTTQTTSTRRRRLSLSLSLSHSLSLSLSLSLCPLSPLSLHHILLRVLMFLVCLLLVSLSLSLTLVSCRLSLSTEEGSKRFGPLSSTFRCFSFRFSRELCFL
jgi:hypothetical protein